MPARAESAHTPSRKRKPWRGVLLTLAAVTVIASIATYLTAPRPGGTMDPESTSGSGARALVTLLREGGVEVVVANTVADVENAARADTLLLVAQTQYLANNALLNRLSRVPGDLLLVEPTARTRRVLTPKLRVGAAETLAIRPDCPLREADRAGTVRFGPSDAYRGKGELAMISCYGGALVRYQDVGRTVTVVGSNHFMTNDGLREQGNAALAMNLAGARPRLIWYAPHLVEGETSSPSSLSDLIPANVSWIVWQLWLAVILVALRKGRRMGPLVAEEMPVVVRASETVEGRGRLYRSRRARDRAADALRTATLQRLLPRLGIGSSADPQAVAITVAQRSGADAGYVWYHLFGPPPADDHDLLQLARALDDIERQVTHS
ncbi:MULTISPECIES: DUF4350 domain-containing protein [Mycobacterium]|uniref:Membrane protein n=1 Tax=Mycobacterium pseudoshottsii TaxID=265949 RepID=A0A9N7LP07_9MYCO|nr:MULTISPECIES: DUF4350 domain-containing protein [Mycobacterium]MBC9865631.1 putative secreted protein [Mycobacterium pseudoshottsii]RFZ65248.1 hypothetical protein DL240490_02359 [Mycobacterium marinum]BBA86010.1 putative membrane protein [Mycobacterium pseudoshottsii JCM 15466]BDN80053.1 putative membrane protein [Mycobacterium pseudoshottsii]BEH74465.1 putative membrane protein [Mycobacterium pseudoshottsii]